MLAVVAGDEIVDPDDAMAFGEQSIREMGAEEAGAAGDDRSGTRGRHAAALLLAAAEKSAMREHADACNGVRHRAPKPKSTTGMVFSRILMSSQSDQLSMYSRSSFTQSSKLLIWLRPLICQRQVRPGFMLKPPALRGALEFLDLVDRQRARADEAHLALAAH